MDSSNNTAINILDRDNWSRALLVKDERGNFAHLQPESGGNFSVNSQNFMTSGALSEGNVAPKDPSFSSLPNISGSSQDKSELVFHPDDKEELDFLAKSIPQDDSKKYSIEKIVARIMEKQNLVFDDRNKKIFINLLYNFFRSRKNAAITRELLSKNVLVHNKQLAPNIVDNILSVIKSIKGRIDLEGGLVVNKADLQVQREKMPKKEEIEPENKEIQSVGNLKVEADLSAQDEIQTIFKQADKKNTTSSAEENKEESEPKIEVPKFQTENLAPDKPAKKEEKTIAHQPAEGFSIPSGSGDIESADQKEIDNMAERVTSLPRVSRPGMAPTVKKSMTDVVMPAKPAKEETADLTYAEDMVDPLTGSIPELKSFDLIGFRRLGDSAEHRVAKILEKINLLEQESYTKKAQGISAWRNSGVYQLYLKLGAESMSEGKKVEEYIKEKEDKNEDILSVAEFSAISDLNKQLRF